MKKVFELLRSFEPYKTDEELVSFVSDLIMGHYNRIEEQKQMAEEQKKNQGAV